MPLPPAIWEEIASLPALEEQSIHIAVTRFRTLRAILFPSQLAPSSASFPRLVVQVLKFFCHHAAESVVPIWLDGLDGLGLPAVRSFLGAAAAFERSVIERDPMKRRREVELEIGAIQEGLDLHEALVKEMRRYEAAQQEADVQA
ncbi:hypothetical protein JCM11641_002972 [Rhodosporidiobolus odoratus]